MKTSSRSSRLAVFCFGVFSAAISPTAHAEFKCDGRPLRGVDAKGCAHAAQGPDSLRRFVTRTQAIYGVQMKDYVRFVGDEPPAKIASTSKESLAKSARSSNQTQPQ